MNNEDEILRRDEEDGEDSQESVTEVAWTVSIDVIVCDDDLITTRGLPFLVGIEIDFGARDDDDASGTRSHRTDV